MRRIVFIDVFIDEWHAGNEPGRIRQSRFRGEFDAGLPWQETEMPEYPGRIEEA